MRLLKIIDERTPSQVCFDMMVLLNFVVVLYSAMVPAVTMMRASQKDSMSFLLTLRNVSYSPFEIMYLSVCLYLVILSCMYAKYYFSERSLSVFIGMSMLEIVVLVNLMFILNVSNTGIIFLIVAENLSYVETRRNWMWTITVAFLAYLACDYNLLSIFFQLNSFETFAAFYEEGTRGLILSINDFCTGLNIVFFFLQVALMILMDKQEKNEIATLNYKQSIINERLKRANMQLQEYATEREQMGEMKERNRLAREIHDTIGHTLTGITVGLEAVQILVDLSPEKAKKQLNTLAELSKNGLNDVRMSVRKLSPDNQKNISVDHSIYQLVKNTSETTGTKIYFMPYRLGLRFMKDEEDTIYRVIQEAMTNAIRHGKASEIWIRMDRIEEGVQISVIDNGKGCGELKEGFGLVHMRERVEMLGGRLAYYSEDGFRVEAIIPIRQDSKTEGKDSV